jgi:hypothetical protein
MNEDSAIRIEFHSAEVVHFTHNIQIFIVWASSLHKYICHDKYPIVVFHLPTSAQWLPPRDVPLNTGVQAAVFPGVAKSPAHLTLQNDTVGDSSLFNEGSRLVPLPPKK